MISLHFIVYEIKMSILHVPIPSVKYTDIYFSFNFGVTVLPLVKYQPNNYVYVETISIMR
jgi:hypothetical protein